MKEWIPFIADLFQVLVLPVIAWGMSTLNRIGNSIVELKAWSRAHDLKDDANEKRTAESIRDLWKEIRGIQEEVHRVEIRILNNCK